VSLQRRRSSRTKLISQPPTVARSTIRSGWRDTGTAERRLAQLQQERVAIFTHASNVLTTVFVLLIGAAVVIALHRSPQPVW